MYATLIDLLKQNPNYFSDSGELLRNAVYESAMKMDNSLIKLLLSNKETKSSFLLRSTAFSFLIKSVLVGLSTIARFCLIHIRATKIKSV